MAKDLYSLTKKRLASYGVFSNRVVERVARFAETQDEYESYQAYLTAMGVGKPFVHLDEKARGVAVVDIPARSGNQKGILVVHIAMGNSLDENQLYQLATLAGIYADHRIIGFGNPSGDRYYVREQKLSLKELYSVAFTKNIRPLVAAEIDYLKKFVDSDYYQIGYSFGALKASIESGFVTDRLKGLLIIDPVSHPRNPFRLLKDFSRTYGPLGKYVNNAELELYHRARGDAAKDRNFKKGLRRPINIAIAFLLSRTHIFNLISGVLQQLPLLRLGIAWGTASELSEDVRIQEGIETIKSVSPDSSILPLRLEGLEHAFANDPHLYAAIVGQFLDFKG